MAKKPKPRPKKGKPGPHEERLVITGDPREAIDKLLKKKPERR